MSLNKANITWTGKQLKSMSKNGSIKTDNIVQRGLVWNKEKKTYFIDSILRGYPIPALFTRRFENGVNDKGKVKKVYDLLDGKQRVSTFISFLNNEWQLGQIEPIIYEVDDEEFEIDITGMSFSDLPDEIKYMLETATLSIIYFDDLEREEEIEMFKRLNSGQPLSAKSKTLASCRNIEDLLWIGSHDLFKEMLSTKAQENKNQAIIVMKIWTMLHTPIDEVCFTSKVFNPLVEKAEVTKEMENELRELFDFIQETHAVLIAKKNRKTAKKLYTETHLLSLTPYFAKALERGWDCDTMADFICRFYCGEKISISNEYNMAVSNAVASNASITKRDTELKIAFETFSDTIKSVREVEDRPDSIKEQAEKVAEKLRNSLSLEDEDCEELCKLAEMEDEWENREESETEIILEKAAEKLGVDIAA